MFKKAYFSCIRLTVFGMLILFLQGALQAQITTPSSTLSGPTRLTAERDHLYQELGDTVLIDNAVTEYLLMCASLQAINLTEQVEGDASSRFEELEARRPGGGAAEGNMNCTYAVPDSLFFCPQSKFATAGCSSLKMPTNWVVALGIQQEIKGICPPGVQGTVALMAQAVLWRTYGVKRNQEGSPANRGQAVALAEVPNLRCFLAALMTTGQVLLGSDPNGHDYGKLIFAAYSARCNGDITRSAEDGVWHNTGTCSEGGNNVSYLQSVTCSGHDNCDGTGETPCCATNDGQSVFGHGVGACQRGIVGFAKLGWTHEQILLHYFSDKVCIAKPAVCNLSAPAPTQTDGCDYVVLTAQTPISGTAPYSYTWSTGETSMSTRTNQKGTYTVTITDAVCSITRSVKVTSIPNSAPFQVAAFPVHPNCATGTSGKVFLFGAQPTWAVEWSDGQITFGKWRYDMSAGDYAITVVNNKGCSATTNVVLVNQNCDLAISISIGTCNTRWLKPITPANIAITEYWWKSLDSAIPDTRADSLPVWMPGEYSLTVTTVSNDTLRTNYTVPLGSWGTYQPLAIPQLPCSNTTLNGSAISGLSWPWLGGESYIIDNEGPHSNFGDFTQAVRAVGVHTFTTIYPADGCEVSSQYEIATKHSTEKTIPISIVGDSLVADLSSMGIPANFGEFNYYWRVMDTVINWPVVSINATVPSTSHTIPITVNGLYRLRVRSACDEDYTLYGEIAINHLNNASEERNELISNKLNHENNNEEIIAMPNPTSGNTTINGAHGEVVVYSATGAIVARVQSVGSVLVDLSAQPAGIYCARVFDSRGVMHTMRLVKAY